MLKEERIQAIIYEEDSFPKGKRGNSAGRRGTEEGTSDGGQLHPDVRTITTDAVWTSTCRTDEAGTEVPAETRERVPRVSKRRENERAQGVFKVISV